MPAAKVSRAAIRITWWMQVWDFTDFLSGWRMGFSLWFVGITCLKSKQKRGVSRVFEAQNRKQNAAKLVFKRPADPLLPRFSFARVPTPLYRRFLTPSLSVSPGVT